MNRVMDKTAHAALAVLKWLAITVAAFLALYFALLLFFDFNWLKEPLSRRVHDQTGRELHIEGDLDLRPGWPLPRIRAEKVTFTNPEWAREKNMFTVEKAEIALSLPHLLARKIHLSEVLVAKPVVALEIGRDGRRTWLLDREQSDQESSIGIGKLKIDQGRLAFYNPQENIDLRADFNVGGQGTQSRLPGWLSWMSWRKIWNAEEAKGDADAGDDQGIRFAIKGKFRGAPVDLKGTGGSVFSIRDENYPYPLQISGKLADAAVGLDGTVNGLTTFAAMDVKVDVQGRNLAALKPVVGVALPDTRPYATSGRIRHEDRLWRYEGFNARVGDSDLAGNIDVERGDERTAIRGDFSSRRLRMADFPRRGGDKEGGQAPDGLLPRAEFDTAGWDKLDADVRLRAAAIDAGKLPLRDLSVHATLSNKVATLEDLRLRLAGGSVSGRLSLDGSGHPARGKAELQVNGLRFTELLPAAAKAADKVDPGRMDGRASLSGAGNSVDALLSSADGRLSLVVDGGQISGFIVEAVGIDLWEMLRFKMGGDRNIPIRCGIADFGVKQGVAEARVAVLDTEDTKINITGKVDLGKETLDLTLHPEPKDMSPLALRGPIHVRGPLEKPQVAPDKGRLTLRGLGALALAAVNPLLAIAPLIETGPGTDSDCGALIQEARAAQAKTASQAGQGAATGARSR